ncbi:MAG: flagellar protein FlaG [Spirochaetales bacterium]|jgi:uncharacterized FlaG/YvyC family protein|nr:flagellar protein FlaG [Spirochaetales bacterium]
MDITIDKIEAELLKIPEDSADSLAAAEEDRGKTSESGISGHVNNQQARELTEKLQDYIDRMNINLAFSTYGKNDENVSIIVSEKETGKLIREIPPEELQQLHVKMGELAGMLFNGMV